MMKTNQRLDINLVWLRNQMNRYLSNILFYLKRGYVLDIQQHDLLDSIYVLATFGEDISEGGEYIIIHNGKYFTVTVERTR